MELDQDVRDAILLLVNACNDYQIRALTLTSVLRTLKLYGAEKRESLCECELDAEVRKAYNDAEARVKREAKEVVSALEGTKPFLEAVTKFSTRHYLDSWQTFLGVNVN